MLTARAVPTKAKTRRGCAERALVTSTNRAVAEPTHAVFGDRLAHPHHRTPEAGRQRAYQVVLFRSTSQPTQAVGDCIRNSDFRKGDG